MDNKGVVEFNAAGNPLIRHKYSCDPTALVYNDTFYLFTGHDEAPPGTAAYVMNDWLCFSSEDLVKWKEYPVPLKAADFKWASGDAYASKVIYHKGLFYWYVAISPALGKGKAIGVAVSSTPAGPYTDARGAALITHDMLPPTRHLKANLDPTVLVDDDGQAYIFWGNGACYFARLKENMTALEGDIQVIALPGFQEGAHIHKRNEWYYLSYGYEMPEKVAYAMSKSIHGPWEFKGILNETVEHCETNRPCIVDFKGQSLFVYHNGALMGGGSHRRSVCVDHLRYEEDGEMKKVVMTSEGVRKL